MRIPREDESDGEVINISSLLDVIFILVIFFMATTQFKKKEFDVEVKLPQSAPTPTISAATKLVVINVRKDGTYKLSDRIMSLAELQEAIKSSVAGNPQQKVLVRADRDARHGAVAAAVVTCRHAGIQQANIGYDTKENILK